MSSIQIFGSVQKLNDFTKQDIEFLSREIIREIQESGASEKSYAFLTKLITLAESIKEGIEGFTMDEIDKGNDNAFGVSLKVLERRNFDFKHDSLIKDLEEQVKKRKEFLKSLNKPLEEVNEDGEVITHRPPKVTVKAYIKSDW